jgi:RNA polymerase sigma-70 factor (ECF subfamily)
MEGERFEEILDAAREGDRWALAELYRSVHPRVLRYLRALEPTDAEDLASEAWLDLAAALDRFRGDERALRAFAFTIARRRLVDLRRARTRRGTSPVPEDRLERHGAVGDVEEEAIDALSTRAALERIAALPRDQAEVVLLRVVGGLSVADAARILGKRPGAVRALQHRALKRLARLVSREAVTR